MSAGGGHGNEKILFLSGSGLGNQFLGHIRNVDAVAMVLRAFEDPDIPAASDPGWVHFKEVKAFSRDVEYTMSEGAGSKVLYVWFKDSEGNVSDVQSDTVYRLDPKYVVILLLLVQAVIIL